MQNRRRLQGIPKDEGIVLRKKELEPAIMALHELSLSCDETAKIMNAITEDAKSLRPLWGKPDTRGPKGSRLIKLGISLIAFPIPTIGIKKSLGAMLIAAGLVQERMRHMHVSDVYNTFKEATRELQRLQQKSV